MLMIVMCRVLYARLSVILKIMIPSHFECPNGWRREFYDYVMVGRPGEI